jgi:hypothetical protein
MRWKKGIHLLRRYKKYIYIYIYIGTHLLRRSIFELIIHFAITSLIHTLMKIQLFPRIFDHRVTYQAKEQKMSERHFFT